MEWDDRLSAPPTLARCATDCHDSHPQWLPCLQVILPNRAGPDEHEWLTGRNLTRGRIEGLFPPGSVHLYRLSTCVALRDSPAMAACPFSKFDISVLISTQ